METQARVLAMLNKTKEVRKQRKQNLGAIEDAISEVKSLLDDNASDIVSVIDNYYQDVSGIVNQVNDLASELLTIIQDASAKFSDYESKYLQTALELDNLGISYDSVFPDLGSDFKDTNTYAVDYYNTLTRI